MIVLKMPDPKDAHERDFQLLDERVIQLLEQQRIRDIKEAPIYLLLSHKFYAEDDAIFESYTDGGNDCGVDAVFVQRNLEDPIIHIVQSTYHTSIRKSQTAFKSSALQEIIRFFEILRDETTPLSKVVNFKLEQKVVEIRDIQRDHFPSFKVWLISNGKPCVEHEAAPSLNILRQVPVEVEEFHLSSFVDFCIKRRSSRIDRAFTAREPRVLEYGDSALRSAVGLISARQLFQLIQDWHDRKKIDFTLFDMNVRGFLGSDTTINKAISKSAISRDNNFFAALNNGITIIGSDFKVINTSDQPRVRIKNMNIVNGAQTCSAIFNTMKEYEPDFESFADLSVLFRLFATDSQDLIDQIALSTNSQHRINPRDLKANDDVQKKLENDLTDKGIRYIRKRGDYGIEHDGLVPLDAMKAGQIVLSYIHKDPAAAKRESDQIFAENYGKIFHNLNLEKLVEAFKIFQLIEERKNFITDEIRIRGAFRTENTFVTYGVFHILALCGEFNEQFPDWPPEQLIDESIAVIAEVLKRSDMPAFYSFFRSAEHTKTMLELARQPDLFSG